MLLVGALPYVPIEELFRLAPVIVCYTFLISLHVILFDSEAPIEEHLHKHFKTSTYVISLHY